MSVMFTEFGSRLPSPKVWASLGDPTCLKPDGGIYKGPSGNPAFGFFDHFHSFQATSLEGPYLMLETDGDTTIEQINCTATEKGLLAINMASGTTEDETAIQWGRGLGAPFQLTGNDLAFECRISISNITTALFNIGVGLGDVGMGATTKFFTNSDILDSAADFLGFVKLKGETTDFDGAYQDADGDYVDGAVKTKLNALATFTASATTYHKLGFRYRAHPETVEWYVDGVMSGVNGPAPARLTAAECSVADTFPDDVLLTPILACHNFAGSTAIQVNMDWWACAQYL